MKSVLKHIARENFLKSRICFFRAQSTAALASGRSELSPLELSKVIGNSP